MMSGYWEKDTYTRIPEGVIWHSEGYNLRDGVQVPYSRDSGPEQFGAGPLFMHTRYFNCTYEHYSQCVNEGEHVPGPRIVHHLWNDEDDFSYMKSFQFNLYGFLDYVEANPDLIRLDSGISPYIQFIYAYSDDAGSSVDDGVLHVGGSAIPLGQEASVEYKEDVSPGGLTDPVECSVSATCSGEPEISYSEPGYHDWIWCWSEWPDNKWIIEYRSGGYASSQVRADWSVPRLHIPYEYWVEDPPVMFTIITLPATEVWATGATIHGMIKNDGEEAGYAYAGFQWGSNSDVSAEVIHWSYSGSYGHGKVPIQATISGLLPDRTYYYRACLHEGTPPMDEGNIFGDTLSFGGPVSIFGQGWEYVTAKKAEDDVSKLAVGRYYMDKSGNFVYESAKHRIA